MFSLCQVNKNKRRHKTTKSLLNELLIEFLDISMTGVVRMVSLYSEQVTLTSYNMSLESSVSDARIQQFVDNKVKLIKDLVFSGRINHFLNFVFGS